MAKQQTGTGRGQPLTSHPQFPAVVALWLGTLLGLGSLVIRTSLIESLVVASRIGALLLPAAPPLGFTARALIALFLTALGAVLGAWIGRKLVMRRAGQSAQSDNREAAEAAAMPAAVSSDLSDVPASEVPVVRTRRRALALDEPDLPYTPLDHAPLPGFTAQILDIAGTGIAPLDAVEVQLAEDPPAFADTALETTTLETVTVEAEPACEPAPAEEPATPAAAVEAPTTRARPPYARPFGAREPAVTPAPEARVEANPIPAELPLTDLAERLKGAMLKRREDRQAANTEIAQAETPAEVIAEEVSKVLPRFGEARSAEAEVAPLVLPAAMRAVSAVGFAADEDDEAVDLHLASLLPPRRLAEAAVPSPDLSGELPEAATLDAEPLEEDESWDESAPEADFSSLLAIGPRGHAARSIQPPEPSEDAEPVVIFPGQTASKSPLITATPFDRFGVPSPAIWPDKADPAATEQALKQALAGLQRMTGSA